MSDCDLEKNMDLSPDSNLNEVYSLIRKELNRESEDDDSRSPSNKCRRQSSKRKCNDVVDEFPNDAGSTSAGSLREIRLTSIIDQLRINNRLKVRSNHTSVKAESSFEENGSGGGDQPGVIGPGGVGPGGRQRQGRRRGPPATSVHNGTHDNPLHNNNNSINIHGTIKHERLSPQNATERSSSRSRSVTPSTGSFPGTPPQTGGPGSGDRGSSPAHPHSALPHGQLPPPPHALARNYSDFMRSLAAKYNNTNSNDFFAGARPMVANGYTPPMDPRFALKAPPFVGLLGPPSGIQAPARSSPPPPAAAESRDRPVGGLFAGYAYANGGPRGLPIFPSTMDMSSTKALLAIARVANAAKEAEMTGDFIKGASKRPPGSISNDHPLSSPLDLSSAAGANMFAASAAKKSRLSPKNETSHHNESCSSSGSASCGESGDVSPGIDCKLSLDIDTKLLDQSKNDSRNGSYNNLSKYDKSQRLSGGPESPSSFGRKSPASSGRKSPGSTGRKTPPGKDCGSCCRSDGRRECVPDPEIASWNVDDVCKFVESIDICAEYSPIFREQRIDGSGLPLLTEDHLTGLLRMKLGPALKMKSLLAGRMGNCHHCRCQQTVTPTSAAQTSPSPSTTPSSNLLVKMERPPSTDSDNS